MKLKTLIAIGSLMTALIAGISYTVCAAPANFPVLTFNVVNTTSLTFTETSGFTPTACSKSSTDSLGPKGSIKYTCHFGQGFLLTSGTYHADYTSISGINTTNNTSPKPMYQITALTDGKLKNLKYYVTGAGKTVTLPGSAQYTEGSLQQDMTFNIKISQ